MLDAVRKWAPVIDLTREDFQPGQKGVDRLSEIIGEEAAILIDIGGYFAPAVDELSRRLNLKAIIEDTTNGHERYSARAPLVPVVSVARSPTKAEFEDVHVAGDIVLATHSILDRIGVRWEDLSFLIQGFGQIGAGLSVALTAREPRAPRGAISVLDRDSNKTGIAQLQCLTVGDLSLSFEPRAQFWDQGVLPVSSYQPSQDYRE